ncbi:MAG: IS1 family transposase [Lunatimonas sp.]|uniref:IS1/IS1595 family N-terminal zinc-binding domain-containing protein n=1 Tax=Lunatimonas sp. TaxID=2060141 RepID=UPI00263B80DA|nr:helix-turn-helix domain-containing protein [Lunatimonas sp.]MCC5937790.1 IS1 family transposase [Lunatimonas sp.]
MKDTSCPKCDSSKVVKSGIINGKQRFRCKNCGYHFTVQKQGKAIDKYYVVKALQLYIEGVSYREIERILGVSHVSVMNWVRQYRIKAPENYDYRPTYKVFNHTELVNFMSKNSNLKDSSMLVTELGDKYMIIQWERFKHR